MQFLFVFRECLKKKMFLFVVILKSILFAILIAWLFYDSFVFFLLFPFVFFIILKKETANGKQKQKERETRQFFEFLGFLKEAMNAGNSMERAVFEARKGLLETAGEEEPFLKKLFVLQQKLLLSVPVEQGFAELSADCCCEELNDFAEVLSLAKRTGGTVTKIISNTELVLKEKRDTYFYINRVLYGKLYETAIMKAIPFAMLSYLRLCLPGFLSPLYHNMAGTLLMTIVLLCYLILCSLVDRISKIRHSS